MALDKFIPTTSDQEDPKVKKTVDLKTNPYQKKTEEIKKLESISELRDSFLALKIYRKYDSNIEIKKELKVRGLPTNLQGYALWEVEDQVYFDIESHIQTMKNYVFIIQNYWKAVFHLTYTSQTWFICDYYCKTKEEADKFLKGNTEIYQWWKWDWESSPKLAKVKIWKDNRESILSGNNMFVSSYRWDRYSRTYHICTDKIKEFTDLYLKYSK